MFSINCKLDIYKVRNTGTICGTGIPVCTVRYQAQTRRNWWVQRKLLSASSSPSLGTDQFLHGLETDYARTGTNRKFWSVQTSFKNFRYIYAYLHEMFYDIAKALTCFIIQHNRKLHSLTSIFSHVNLVYNTISTNEKTSSLFLLLIYIIYLTIIRLQKNQNCI